MSKKIQNDVPDELFEQLMRVAEAMGLSNSEAATVGLAEWVSRRKSELDDRDPNEKYEVNEALDELLERKSNFSVSAFATKLGVAALITAVARIDQLIARASGAGLDVEVPFEIKALKALGLVAPYFVQDNHGTMVVSDQAGGVYSVMLAGKATALADKTKIKNPAGVAIGPAGFGSYEGSVFVLAAAGGIKGVCEVERIDKSGAVSTFVKLPDAAATECRDLEFGATGSPFAGKLYAVASGNDSIYTIDASGKASVFGTYTKPVPFELTTITFPPSSDTKAAGTMLVGMRAKGSFAAKV